jgi:dephospho-CoA kinase
VNSRPAAPVTRIGLTGGIASGKSTVSARLAELGAVVIDSDRLAREVVGPGTPGLAAVIAEFGDGVVADDGTLDRSALGRLVFADPEARRRLEAIVHPLVRSRATELEAAAPGGSVIVQDVPLLVEAGLADQFDIVVVVDVDDEVQRGRLRDLRGLSEAEADSRIRAQATRRERLAAADRVIDNSGSPDELRAAVDRLWSDLARQT